MVASIGFVALGALAQEHVIDDFRDPAAWTLAASDDVHAALRPAPGAGLCIDFDFGHVTGYVAARRTLPIDFPGRYELGLSVRGDMAANDLQLKLVDAGGENVWWARKHGLVPTAHWQPLRFRQRQIEFAWGPTADRSLRRTAAVEIVIASGSGAGKGSVCFDRLTLRELPPEPSSPPPPTATATSALPGHEAGHAIDADPATDWQPAIPDGAVLTVDFGQPREFGMLSLRWRPGAAATRYRLALSDDGRHWRDSRQVDRARGSVQAQWFADAEARFVQIALDDGSSALRSAPVVALADIELSDAPTVDAFFARLARDAPRGHYPRAYRGEQPYWTVFGVDGGRVASLLGEDGTVEPVPGVGAVEPFLVAGGRVLSWADVQLSQTLRDGHLPMPSVHWRTTDGLTLDIDAFAFGTPDAAQALTRYTVTNTSEQAREVTLALAWRPFQTNPPTQFLAHPGGASSIRRLAWDGQTLSVAGEPRLHALTAPDSVRLEPLAAGPVADWLDDASAGAADAVDDPAGFASGVLRYRLRLQPGERREVSIALPTAGAPAAPAAAAVARRERQVAAHWRQRLDRVRISGPGEVGEIADTVRAALGHILVNRSGPALQPGARAYARSWIRDGALTSSALWRLGQDDVARDFLTWFAPFQFASGKVPCCATARGADPVPENDSDGEFIFAAAELWRYDHDAAHARRLWPRVQAAVAHMEALRLSERTGANLTPERRAYFGLMPPSISHEGYSDRPAYSYWDDFWAAVGYRSAVELAQGLGLADEARRIALQRDEFIADLLASLRASTAQHGLDLLPGSADRGDIDPTSSSIALSPGDLLGTLPDGLVRNTFDRYWHDFLTRRDGPPTWDAYTPYEWRNVGAFVRLGERERALQAMAFFYRDRRPAGWKQWAEVVGRDPRAPRFLGDMPHGWVASDHIRAVLDLFAYEQGQALVLAAGVPMAWLDGRRQQQGQEQGPGLQLQRLRTPYGLLSWQARSHVRAGRRVVDFELQPLRDWPPGGIELRGPWPAGSSVRIAGRAVAGPADRIHLTRTSAGAPTHVRIVLPDTRPLSRPESRPLSRPSSAP